MLRTAAVIMTTEEHDMKPGNELKEICVTLFIQGVLSTRKVERRKGNIDKEKKERLEPIDKNSSEEWECYDIQ